ncbi:MAG: diversity-generating retroelement protein Avd [Acidobacteria bacterium]|nr:diversity-generating retroelement protein Avd [Acidobacteriota bacterium]
MDEKPSLNPSPSGPAPAGPPRASASAINHPEAAPVVGKAYDLVLWLVPVIDRLPRARRFTLGERLESSALELLESLTEAAYRKDKLDALARASRSLQRLRLLVRLSKDLEALDLRRYAHASERIDEVGRMIGGWSKSRKGPA